MATVRSGVMKAEILDPNYKGEVIIEDVAKYVDRIIVMNQGSVMLDGAPRDVFHHYKELEEIGLAAPQVTYLMHEMREAGMDVSTEPTTVDEAKDAILRMLGRK